MKTWASELFHNDNHHIISRYSENTSSSADQTVNTANTAESFHCSSGDLLGPLGLFVQALLAFLAFTSLIVKRYCEPKHSRRPWKIWFFDTSKQAIGAAVIHFANIFLADIIRGDPCTWYLINFLLDSTVGLVVIYIAFKITHVIVKAKKWDSLRFGEYGTPARCNAWVGQCGLYILVMILEKILLTLLILFNFWKDVRKFMMSPITNRHLELVIVMFIVPLIVNAFIFWVVDNFLKRKIQKTKAVYVEEESETSVKYFKSTDRVKYYNRIEKADDFDSDILSTEEDGDVRPRHSDQTECLINA